MPGLLPHESKNHYPEFAAKMALAGIKAFGIRAFRNSDDNLRAGDSGLIDEDSLQPITQLPIDQP